MAFKLIATLILFLSLFLTTPAYAQTSDPRPSPGAGAIFDGLSTAATTAGIVETRSEASIIAGLIQAIIGLTGVAFVILLVYAGILYLTADGEDEKVMKAKKLISTAIIGIIIIISAYAISSFVIKQLTRAIGSPYTRF